MLTSLPAHYRAYLFLLIATLSWGANAVFGLMLVGEASPLLVVFFRWLLVIGLLLVFTGRYLRLSTPLLRRHWRYFALMGASGFAGFNVLFYVAAHSTTALNIGIIQGAIPVFVLIGTFFILHTPIGKMQVVGVVLTVLGVVWVTLKGDWRILTSWAGHSWTLEGDLLMIAACFLYAAYTIGLKRRPADIPSFTLFSWFAICALLAAIPPAIYELATEQALMPTPSGWWIITLIALFPSFAAQISYIRAVEIIGPDRAGLFINLVPIFSSVFAVLVLGESFHSYHAIALMLVLGGIALAERFRVRSLSQLTH